MPTARPALTASHRDVTGKAVARLRRAGTLPAVVFGRGIASVNVSVDTHDFEVLRRHIGPNTLVDLSIDGNKAKPVLIHGVQIHPVTRRPLHADLFQVRMSEELTVDVPLVPTGHSPALELHGGTLIHALEHIRVKALPDHLPQVIEYDTGVLTDFDAVIRVRDLDLPSDVTLLSDPDETVAKVLPPRIEIEEAPPVEAAPPAEVEGAQEAEAPAGQEESPTRAAAR